MSAEIVQLHRPSDNKEIYPVTHTDAVFDKNNVSLTTLLENESANVGLMEYPAFSTSKAYNVGDIVRNNGRLYKFTTTHSAGTWDETQVTLVSMKDQIDEKLTELESEAGYFYNVSNSKEVNACIKELFVNNIDIAEIKYVRFYCDYSGERITGFVLFDASFNELLSAYDKRPSWVAFDDFKTTIWTDDHTYYAVIDWEKVQELCGEAHYKDIATSITNVVYDMSLSPTIKIYYENQKDITIDVYPNGQPNQIANLIRSITDASVHKHYTILVHNGVYEEIDIITKDFIDIIGENQSDVVINCNGDGTYNSPLNYSFDDAYSNVPVNTIPLSKKHTILHMSNSVVKNLTLKAYNCKYICHQDGFTRKFKAVFEDCVFFNDGASEIVGIGAFGGQYYEYRNCYFANKGTTWTPNRATFNLHNWDNQSERCGVKFENCNFVHNGQIIVYELGSGQDDLFEFINCNVDYPQDTWIKYLSESNGKSYSITLNIVGGNIQFVNAVNRYDSKLKIHSALCRLGYRTDASISFGNALTIPDLYIAQNGNDDWAFALSDCGENQQTASLCDVGYGICVAGSYAENDALYISNGLFSKIPNGEIAAYCMESAENPSDSLFVLIKKAKK